IPDGLFITSSVYTPTRQVALVLVGRGAAGPHPTGEFILGSQPTTVSSRLPCCSILAIMLRLGP
ncbi:MAG: hypothetical protein ABW108_18395, partial [Candidatus Thiodiazotropha sp. 6PLUC10]